MRGRICVKIGKYQEALTSWWSVKLDYKLIETAEDGDLTLALDAGGWLRKSRGQKNRSNKRRRENSNIIKQQQKDAAVLCLN